ncbi:hypothetical protein [Actinocrispum wychmicini]|uniref:Winged helix DNA-binding protein n=1 Tax=Actinocrispum wychmicini TaxID=1213861 RepID=A0A4R2J4B1_9PSEU|nr:hypothetical protein [Actinocrispum wychmicini]TCO52964.1 hypothetical protein EV192_111158 [Actinocrispum wychmicini]
MTTNTRSRHPIYPVRRALEHCLSLRDVRPSRIFATLFPLWQAEISAKVHDGQPYDVLDKFIERAITEGGVDTLDGLAGFFGLDRPLVERVLRFLTNIGHVTTDGPAYALTPLGRQSLLEGTRYVWKESRQNLLFDGFTTAPLPREHHSGRISVLHEPELPVEATADRTRFQALIGDLANFRADAVQQLAGRTNRDKFNLRHELHDVTLVSVGPVYLPVYLIEVSMANGRTGCLAFSQVAGERDKFIESLVDDNPAILRTVAAEDAPDPAAVLGRWLERQGCRADALRRQPSGIWRATLPASEFGDDGERFRLHKLGSFEVSQRCFVQLWCDDETTRRRAARQRATQWLNTHDPTTQDDLVAHLRSLSRQLEVDPLTLGEL